MLILHTDDEQTCSTATVRLVGSAHANLYGSISAGINALLLGPLHGGAARAVVEMLERIRRDSVVDQDSAVVDIPALDGSTCELSDRGSGLPRPVHPATSDAGVRVIGPATRGGSRDRHEYTIHR